MEYANGQSVQVGDIVALGEDRAGQVVCSFSDGVYTESYPQKEWGYLERGFLVQFSKFGLIHYEEAGADLKLVSRANSVK